MKILNILHISDLHFSDKNVSLSTIHQKDKSLSPGFISAVSNKPEDQFLIDIVGYKPKAGFDFIACTGDLGDYGKKNNIRLGANYLERLARTLNIPPEKVFISPGNHDLKRNRKPENGLKDFIDVCSSLGFTFSDFNSSKLNMIQEVPILILSTCLGGSEKAYYNYTKDDWDRIKTALKKDERILKEDLDIPAIGKNQLSTLKSNISNDGKGDFSMILMHHNPLPTNNVEVRPYANIIDSGQFISYCIESQKHIIVLHGHTHCEAELTITKHDNNGDKKGWITTLGKDKFHYIASMIEIWLTNDNNFIKADITDIKYVASKYNKEFKSILRSSTATKTPRWIKKIPDDTPRMTFREFADMIKEEADENLAIDLIQNEHRFFDIKKNGSNDFNEWLIGSKI